MDCLMCGDCGFVFGNYCTCKVGVDRKEEYVRLLQASAFSDADFPDDDPSYDFGDEEEDSEDPRSYSNAQYLQILLEKCEWMNFVSGKEAEDRLSSLPWVYVGRNASHYFYIYIEPDDRIILKSCGQGIDIYVAGDDIPVITEETSIIRIDGGRHLCDVYMGHS